MLDLNIVSEWLAVVSLICLVTSEVLAHYGPANGLLIDRRRLRQVAIAASLLLIAVVSYKVYKLLVPA